MYKRQVRESCDAYYDARATVSAKLGCPGEPSETVCADDFWDSEGCYGVWAAVFDCYAQTLQAEGCECTGPDTMECDGSDLCEEASTLAVECEFGGGDGGGSGEGAADPGPGSSGPGGDECNSANCSGCQYLEGITCCYWCVGSTCTQNCNQ